MKFGGKDPECYNCRFCGSDMDLDAFCTHPDIKEDYRWGKFLYTGIDHCRKDGVLTLWERHE